MNDIANGDQNINDMINNDDNDHTLENKSEEDINSFNSNEKMTILRMTLSLSISFNNTNVSKED